MILHPILSQFLVLCSRTTVIAIRINGNTATWSKDTRHLNVFRIHQFNQVFHDDVHTVFMKIAVITETEQIQLQALAFHHLHIRQVADTDFRKIRLPRNRAKTGKLRTVETYPIIILRMFVYKRLQHLRCIILLIYRFLITQQSEFVFSFHTNLFCFEAKYFSNPSRRNLQAGQCPHPSPGIPL